MAKSRAGSGGAKGTYEDCVDHCSDTFPGNSPELTECIKGCATVYGGTGGAGLGSFAISEGEWQAMLSDFLNPDLPDKDQGLTAIYRAIGPGGGSTKDCLNECESEYSRCMNKADGWFDRSLCKLDALSCVVGCGARKLPGGDIAIAY